MSFVLRDVLHEIWDCTETVPENFPIYVFNKNESAVFNSLMCPLLPKDLQSEFIVTRLFDKRDNLNFPIVNFHFRVAIFLRHLQRSLCLSTRPLC